MSIPVLTFFNNKGGVGKTSLIYHLAWMYASLRKRVVVADLDPQANLTAIFLDENTIEEIWNHPSTGSTVYECVKPLTRVGDLVEPTLQQITTDLYLIPGDTYLSGFEDALSDEWPKSLNESNLFRPMRTLSSFWLIMNMAARKVEADVILVDIGPNLGAINRSVLISTDFVVIPLGADLYSLQGLKNLGPTLIRWRNYWRTRAENWNKYASKEEHFEIPEGKMDPIGYLCQQYGARLDRPVKAYDKWVNRIPEVFREFVLEQVDEPSVTIESDPYCLATIKHYRSLVPMAQEHRKPIFNLTNADGAIGGHAQAVQNAKKDFEDLATIIADKANIPL